MRASVRTINNTRVVGVAIMAMLLAACGGDTTATTGAPDATTTTQPDTGTTAPGTTIESPGTTSPEAVTYEAINITIHDWGPQRPLSYGYEWWSEQITSRTNGAVTFDILYSEALGAAADQLENTGAGVFDSSIFAAPYHPAKTPLWNICCLPGMAPGPEAHALALMHEYHDIPEVEGELSQFNVKMLFVISLPSQEYMGTVHISSLEDFEGVRIQAVGVQAEFAQDLGMVPVNIPSSEVYEAIERGTIDGVLFPWNTHDALSIHEVSSFGAEIGGGQVAVPFVINLDVWDSLQPELQDLMLEVAAEVPAENAGYLAEADEQHLANIENAGVEIFFFDEATKQTIQQEVASPLWDSWAEERESEGLPGELALQTLLDAIAKYSE